MDTARAFDNTLRFAKLFTPRQRALRAYRNMLAQKPLTNDVLLDQENGLTLDGSIYFILKELKNSSSYDIGVVRFATQKDNDASFSKELARRGLAVETVVRGSKAYARALATSRYLFTDNAFPPFFVKREGQVLVDTWHGIPLKTLGRKQASGAALIGNVQRNFALSDFIIMPNERMEQRIVDDYMLSGLCDATVLPMGYPRNEPFFTPKDGPVAHKYAWLPTFRNQQGDPRALPAELSERLSEIDRLLDDGEVLYLKVHPASSGSIDLAHFNHIQPLPTDKEAYQALSECEALVSDYSSVVFDFPLGGGKVILWPFDLDEYAQNHGLYDALESLPFPIAKDAESLVELLRSPKNYDDTDFTAKCWPHEDGLAAKTLCERVILGKTLEGEHNVSAPDKPTLIAYTEFSTEKEALLNDLARLSSSYDVRLVFPEQEGAKNEEFLMALPREVKFTPLQDLPVFSLPERASTSNASLAKARKLSPTALEAIKRETARLFGHATFDETAIIDGSHARWTTMVALMKPDKLAE